MFTAPVDSNIMSNHDFHSMQATTTLGKFIEDYQKFIEDYQKNKPLECVWLISLMLINLI